MLAWMIVFCSLSDSSDLNTINSSVSAIYCCISFLLLIIVTFVRLFTSNHQARVAVGRSVCGSGTQEERTLGSLAPNFQRLGIRTAATRTNARIKLPFHLRWRREPSLTNWSEAQTLEHIDPPPPELGTVHPPAPSPCCSAFPLHFVISPHTRGPTRTNAHPLRLGWLHRHLCSLQTHISHAKNSSPTIQDKNNEVI